jgi:Flp pilus assembly protein TadB
MISDADGRRLDEIERLLRLEDPAFARRFDERPRAPRSARSVLRGAVLAALVLVAVPVVTAVEAALGGPLAAVVAMCAVITVCVGVVLWRRAQQRRRWT